MLGATKNNNVKYSPKGLNTTFVLPCNLNDSDIRQNDLFVHEETAVRVRLTQIVKTS